MDEIGKMAKARGNLAESLDGAQLFQSLRAGAGLDCAGEGGKVADFGAQAVEKAQSAYRFARLPRTRSIARRALTRIKGPAKIGAKSRGSHDPFRVMAGLVPAIPVVTGGVDCRTSSGGG